jgi:hypothetical protein
MTDSITGSTYFVGSCSRFYDGRNNKGTTLTIYFQYLTKMRVKMASENYLALFAKLLILNGGQRRDRTADAGLFKGPLPMGLSCLESADLIESKTVSAVPI